MYKEMINEWREIWEDVANRNQGKSLFEINGYRLDDNIAEKVSDYIDVELYPQETERLLEVGCGSGALLVSFKDKCGNIYGVDFSEEMIKIAKDNLPYVTFEQAEANNLHIYPDGSFDKIFSYSVFQYFPSIDYGVEAVKEMIRVANPTWSIILVLDIPDIDKRDDAEAERKRMGKNPLPPLLYYDKKMFIDSFKCEVFDMPIRYTDNSKYRFCLRIVKDEYR